MTAGLITEVAGVRVGHWTGDHTGVTVVLLPPGTVGSGEVRGGAPATRKLALLEATRTVAQVDAVVFTGGSAFGLAAADGTALAGGTRYEFSTGGPAVVRSLPYEGSRMNWRMLVEVEPNTNLYLRALSSGVNGLVFTYDPITSTGAATNTPNQSNAVLNPHRDDVVLDNSRDDAIDLHGGDAESCRFNGCLDLNRSDIATDDFHPECVEASPRFRASVNLDLDVRKFGQIGHVVHATREAPR
jgi:hypothetical protein